MMYPMPPIIGWWKLLGMAWETVWPFLAGFAGGKIIAYLTFGRYIRMLKKVEDEELELVRVRMAEKRPPESLSLRQATPQQIMDELSNRCIGEGGMAILIFSKPEESSVYSAIVGDKRMCVEQAMVMMKRLIASAKADA